MGHANPPYAQIQSPPPVDVAMTIYTLENREREGLAQAPAPALSTLSGVPFVGVRGLAAFWRVGDEPDLLSRLEDLLIALNGTSVPFHFLLSGSRGQIRCFLGLEIRGGDDYLRPLLASLLPGALLDDKPTSGLDALPVAPAGLGARGTLTGIPSRPRPAAPRPDDPSAQAPTAALPTPAGPVRPDQIERVIRGMHGYTWGWWLRAAPFPRPDVIVATDTLIEEITKVNWTIKQQLSEVSMETQQTGPNQNRGITRTVANERVNAQSEFAVQLLQKQRERLEQAKSLGMWAVSCQAFANDGRGLERLLGLLRAVYSGPDSTPEPVRTHPARETGAPPLRTLLTTAELATLAQLPQQEFQGYRIAPFTRFDTDPPPPPAAPFPIGRILDGERDTATPFAIDQNDLAKHALVAGMTGSGKTTTIFKLLLQLRDQKRPFLVIEPAKAEYRDLLGAIGGGPSGPVPDLRVYTLGDETVAPFRLNPFEFDVMDVDNRVHVQTHIDYLKAVFNAAFILYAPMPYVLEMCLHEIYTDAGWDLATGLNTRLAAADYKQIGQWPIFPTLGDLYDKFDEVVDRLGYEERIAMDVKAGLKARVGSLMLGSKGLMLNCRRGVPTLELLNYPTVLELERIGNDDEKAFIIGLVMARLYEFRRLQASVAGQARSRFRHLTVIEEAHRLLKNVSTDVPVEGANTRGQAVETFANMLSEVRGYGQGFLIAEQIPSKLTPDALKNTNLKLIHRLTAADERQTIAGATNMNAEQAAHLSTLINGRFVAHAEQADHPYLLTVEDVRKQRFPQSTTDSGVRDVMRPHTRSALYEPVRGYWRHVSGGRATVNTYRYALAERVLDDPHFDEAWAAVMLHILRAPKEADVGLVVELTRLAQATGGALAPDELQEVARAAVALAVDRTIHRRGRLYRWPYARQHALHDKLLAGMIALVDGQATAARPALADFVRDYRQATTLREGPFVGCEPCRVRCWLRPDVAALAAQPGLREEMDGAFIGRSRREAQEEMALTAMATVSRAAERVAPTGGTGGGMPREVRVSAAVCLLAQMMPRMGLSRGAQRDTVMMADKMLSPAAPGNP